MLNKNKIIYILKKYNLDKTNYIILSGAALVLLGLKKETRDIDIAVTKSYYDYLLKNYDCKLEKINEWNNGVYYIDNIINFGIDFYSNHKILVNGFPVQTLEEIKKLKLLLNRKKDKKDIEIINKYLNN